MKFYLVPDGCMGLVDGKYQFFSTVEEYREFLEEREEEK